MFSTVEKAMPNLCTSLANALSSVRDSCRAARITFSSIISLDRFAAVVVDDWRRGLQMDKGAGDQYTVVASDYIHKH